jgi:hypothetical protein
MTQRRRSGEYSASSSGKPGLGIMQFSRRIGARRVQPAFSGYVFWICPERLTATHRKHPKLPVFVTPLPKVELRNVMMEFGLS